jgi:branched-subunit amino acid aminotransferase/4-amino-4-deoxychorismate lyase
MGDMAEENLTWQPDFGLRPTGSDTARLLVADSWLLEDGKVRGLELHQYRFRGSCVEASGIETSEVDKFWHALRYRLPRAGSWFPRAELVTDAAGPRLRLRLRPAPARTDEAVVWVHTERDPRTTPRRKGPDLDRLSGLRHRATAAGANEALLTTDSGFVLEAATSSLLWWEGDQLCLPDPSWRILPSVTVELIRRAAESSGTTVHRCRRKLTELAGREVWLANALHGIRPVVGWVGSTVRAGVPIRAAEWRQWWQACAEALPESRVAETPAP